jgi:hypothetical protein
MVSRDGKNTDPGYLRAACEENVLDLTAGKQKEARENCIRKSFIICIKY